MTEETARPPPMLGGLIVPQVVSALAFATAALFIPAVCSAAGAVRMLRR